MDAFGPAEKHWFTIGSEGKKTCSVHLTYLVSVNQCLGDPKKILMILRL